MYSVRLGHDKAISRIKKLVENKHYSEAFVVTVFTVEKTLRRTLHQLIVSAGFSTEITKKIHGRWGIKIIQEQWYLYDPKNRGLIEVIGNNTWRKIDHYSKMRNKLVHGHIVYNRETCKKSTEELLKILDDIKKKFSDVYGYSGWERLAPRSKCELHVDPKVKVK